MTNIPEKVRVNKAPNAEEYGAAGIGIPAATILAWILGLNEIAMPPGVEAAVAGLITVLVSYATRLFMGRAR